MKSEEVRQRLEQLSAEDLRLVAARLYKMLPKKMAEEKGADRLLCDPQGFLKSAKVARLPALPEIDMVEFETSEFLENAREQRYFAPNRIISKSERGRWRFVAKKTTELKELAIGVICRFDHAQHQGELPAWQV